MTTASHAPGVRVIEAAPVALPPNVGPTLAGFMGQARRGRVDIPQLVTSWSSYNSLYGGFSSAVDLAVHIRQFFDNGGAACRVLRMAASDAVGADTSTTIVSRSAGACMTVYAASPGEWGDDLSVKLALQEVLSTGGQSLVDVDSGVALPNDTSNPTYSLDTVAVPVDNVTKIGAGNVVDVFTAAGVYHADALCLAVDSANRRLVMELPTGMDVSGAGFYLRSNSQHRVKTYATESLAHGQASLLLNSVDGITRGSLLTIYLYSHCRTLATRGVFAVSKAVVDRVAGNRVYFTAVSVNTPAQTIPATASAALRYTANEGGTIFVDFVAKDAGTAGNKVAVTIVTGADANSISVSGKTITVNSDDYTLAGVKAAIEADTRANALVTVTITGLTTTVVSLDLAETRLTGGAQLQVVSQEFGMEVYLADDLAERHDYLSMVSTSPDFITARIGGTPATFEPVSGSQSNMIIVSDVSETIGTGAVEYTDQPRALSSVGFSGGDDGTDLTDDDWIGTSSPSTGSYLLASYEDIKLACAPGVTSPDVQKEFVARAEESGKFVWLLDPPSDATDANALVEHRVNDLGLNTSFGQLASTSGYVQDMRTGAMRGALIEVQATPAWAGLIAVAQANGGSHKSPGNLSPNWVRVKFNAGPTDADLLHDNQICVFRTVAGAIRCYGDRTLLQIKDPRRFGNARRFLCQFIHDAEAALADVIFQPGNEDVFGLVESKLTRILTEAHAVGALYPREDIRRAFSVACNAETTTPDDIAEGVYYVEVALSPAGLAEQIIMRLQVSAGGLSVTNNI